MTATKKAASKSQRTGKKSPVKKSAENTTVFETMRIRIQAMTAPLFANTRALMNRRPHRSFKRTYRRDYVRSLNMPGYWAFTHSVHSLLWKNKKTFLYLVLVYAAMTAALVNLTSESLYAQMRDTVEQTSEGVLSGFWGEIGKAGLLLMANTAGLFNESSTGTQSQVYAVIIGLLTWLTTVWLLRVILAGRKPKMRDGLYNAGAPIVSTIIVTSVIVVQMLPLAVAVFGYGAATTSGLLEGGVEAMLFWAAAALLVMLSLYWITTTLIALVVVTLPGMYPLRALQTAGDLVVGRRLRILLRLLWMVAAIIIAWIVIAIPIILLDGWLKGGVPAIGWLPIVPLTLLILSSVTVVWTASYVYLLYRRIVEDDSLPA